VQQQDDALMRQAQTFQATPEQVQAGREQGLTPQQTQELIRQEATNQVQAERFQSTVSGLRKTLEDNGASDALARLSNQKLTPFEPDSVTALSEAKFPAKVAKAIANNEEVFSKFSSLPDAGARARFIARLDGRFESRATGEGKSTSTPKPTPRVRGAARKPEKDPEDMSQAEYEAYAEKQGWL